MTIANIFLADILVKLVEAVPLEFIFIPMGVVLVVTYGISTYVGVYRVSLKPARERKILLQRLEQEGVRAAATITSMEKTGMTRGHFAIEMRLSLNVQLPEGEQIKTVVTEMVPVERGVKTGERLWVDIIPDEPDAVAITDFYAEPPPLDEHAIKASAYQLKERLGRLDVLLEEGAISVEEHQEERKRVLSEI